MGTLEKNNPPKVVILCGGKGNRLRELTEFIPKPLVTIGSAPILWHIMKIYAHFGFKDFILCLGYKGEMIKNYFLNLAERTNDFTLDLNFGDKRITYHHPKLLNDWRITFVDTGAEAQTGARIYRIRDFVKNDQEFFLTYSDAVSDINLEKLLTHHREKNKILTVTGIHAASSFGVIEHESGLVKRFQEKPKTKEIISGGFFVCQNDIFEYLENNDECVFENQPMKQLAEKGQLALYEHPGFWSCMDTQKHVDELNNLWQKGGAPWQVW
mgnify:CR=1 FL=1